MRLERYVQARIGGNHPAETTGKWAAAKFEHDSARPVDGYSAPQLHTHVVFFNVTETEDGNTRAVQPRELYKSQQYATAVYQSELAWRLKALGYETRRRQERRAGNPRATRRNTWKPSARAASRSKRILKSRAWRVPDPAQIAAHRTRDAKLALCPEEMLAKHQE